MKIEKMPINKIKPSKINPRKDLKPGDEEYEKIKRSIEEFGFIEPLVLNKRDNVLISGHQRYKILCEQGIKETDVVVVDYGPEKAKACTIMINKAQGDWDNVKLATLLDELEQLPDFDVGLTGFDEPEISILFDQYLSTGEEDDFDVKKEAETITEPITQRGDIIELGSHRLLCGDAVDLEDLKKLFQGKTADLVVSDPPYNCAYKNERPVQRKGGKK